MKRAIVFAQAVVTAGVMAMAGCSTNQRPVLYPNQHMQTTGPSVAQADIDECMRMAQSSGVKTTGGRVADPEDVAVNTGTAAASGAARGAVWGHAGKGAAAGAAGAATGTIVRSVLRPRNNPTHHRFVETCLRQKGYQVVGWQ